MAKSGMYLNGRELLECELEKLDRIDRLKVTIETNQKNTQDAQLAAWGESI